MLALSNELIGIVRFALSLEFNHNFSESQLEEAVLGFENKGGLQEGKLQDVVNLWFKCAVGLILENNKPIPTREDHVLFVRAFEDLAFKDYFFV